MARHDNSTNPDTVLVSAIIPNSDATAFIVESGSASLPAKKQDSGTHERTFTALSKEVTGQALSIDHMRGRQTGVGAVMFALAKPLSDSKAHLAEGYEWCTAERAEQLRHFAQDLFKLHEREEGGV